MQSGGFVVGIDIGGTNMTVATADRSGTVLRRETIPTQRHKGAQQALERVLAVGSRLVSETREQGELIGVGVATMGITYDNHVALAPNVPGWSDLHIPTTVRASFAAPAIVIENDVKAAAWAEARWGALRGSKVGLLLNLGTGIAVAAVIDGCLYRGAHDASGEIGYNLTSAGDGEGFARGMAPLEDRIGGGAIERRVREIFGDDHDIERVFALAQSDARSQAFVDEVLGEIALHVTNCAVAFDVDRIVVSGGLMSAAGQVLSVLARSLSSFVPFPPELAAARFVHDAPLMGAIALVLEPAEGLPANRHID